MLALCLQGLNCAPEGWRVMAVPGLVLGEGEGLLPLQMGDAPSAVPGTAMVLFGFETCPEPGGSFGSGSRLLREFVEGVCHLNLEINLEEGTEN